MSSRRDFCKQITGAAGAILVSPSLSAAATPPEMPIVDTHQHLWDLQRFRLPWLDTAGALLNRTYTLEDYRQATDGLLITTAIYMEVDVVEEQQGREADFVIDLTNRPDSPTVAGVISGRCDKPSFELHIRRFANEPKIKGVRHLLGAAPAGTCLTPQFVRSVRLLGDLGKHFDLTMNPQHLADGVELARRCPGTRFVLDHCGTADPKAFLKNKADTQPAHDAESWRREIASFAKLDNVVCKISGIVASAPTGWTADHLAPIVNHCLDEFGPQRVVFGSDWPVVLRGGSLREWVTALREIVSQRTADEQRKLFSENAVRWYDIMLKQ